MKIKLSHSQWESAGKQAGWIRTAIIPDDGFADGGERYTDEEMDLMEKQDKTANEVKLIKEQIAKTVDEFGSNLLSSEGFELRMKELIRKMFQTKGIQPNPNVA